MKWVHGKVVETIATPKPLWVFPETKQERHIGKQRQRTLHTRAGFYRYKQQRQRGSLIIVKFQQETLLSVDEFLPSIWGTGRTSLCPSIALLVYPGTPGYRTLLKGVFRRI